MMPSFSSSSIGVLITTTATNDAKAPVKDGSEEELADETPGPTDSLTPSPRRTREVAHPPHYHHHQSSSMSRASRTHCEKTDNTVAQQFNSMVAAQKYRAAVRTLTNRSGGGLLEVEGANTKSGRPVIDVLREKHPPARDVEGRGGRVELFRELPSRPRPPVR